jgi:hypothetical protein
MIEPFTFFVAGPRNLQVNPLLGEQVGTLTGITSGPGNQGTANMAQLMGHAGTPASQTGVPRQIKAGGSSMLGTV